MPSAAVPSPSSRSGVWLRLALIALAVLVVYWPARHGAWLWDDQKEILRNPELRDLASLGRAWIEPQNTTYYPLTTTLLWIELHLWGDNPAGYHAVSIALHLLSALLVWRLLGRLGLRHAWWGGLLFAVHPLAVESVAWVAELKNTASLPLLLLACLQFLEFDRTDRRGSYAGALACFLLAMLCKTAVTMLPPLLLLHAWWSRGRIARRDVFAAAPFFAVALALGSLTLWFEHHRAIGSWEIPAAGPTERVAIAGLALAHYLGKLFVPLGLMPVYPQWSVAELSVFDWWPWLVLAGLAGGSWRARARWGRHVLFALGFIVLNAAPALGFVPIAFMRYSWVADHLVYVSSIGAVALAVGSAPLFAARFPAKSARGGVFAAAAIALTLTLLARRHAATFAGPEVFWGHALRANPQAWIAHANLGQHRLEQRDLDGAVAEFRAGLHLAPKIVSLHFNLGTALLQAGRPTEAVAAFEEVLRLEPGAVDARVNAAAALLQLGRIDAARNQLQAALATAPKAYDARLLLGECHEAQERFADAAREYAAALELRPKAGPARLKLANARYALEQLPEAAKLYEQVLAQEPANVEALTNFGGVLLQTGQPAAAAQRFESALKLEPRNVQVLTNLATALAAQGRLAEARTRAEAALRVDPGFAPARELLDALRRDGAAR